MDTLSARESGDPAIEGLVAQLLHTTGTLTVMVDEMLRFESAGHSAADAPPVLDVLGRHDEVALVPEVTVVEALPRLVAAEDPEEVAARLHQQVTAAGCQALNVRVFHAGLTPAACRAQIEGIGRDVLPALLTHHSPAALEQVTEVLRDADTIMCRDLYFVPPEAIRSGQRRPGTSRSRRRR